MKYVNLGRSGLKVSRLCYDLVHSCGLSPAIIQRETLPAVSL